MAASSESDPLTPTVQLAKQIAQKLNSEGLLSDLRRGEFEQKIVAGRVTQEDWKLWLEQVPTDE